MNSGKEIARGCFVSFEGTDGAGKSTIARRVFEQVRGDTGDVVFLEKNRPIPTEPYAAFHLAKIREILWEYEPSAPLGVLGDFHWLHLIASWFHATYECSVRPHVEQGRVVIADGWHYKYLARFALKKAPLSVSVEAVFGGIPTPDRMILLDVDPAVAAQRKMGDLKPSESGELDGGVEVDRRRGFISYQTAVREVLLSRATPDWVCIDTTALNEDAIVERAVKSVLDWIPALYRSEDRLALELRI